VCSGLELDQVRAAGLASMVPGIRPAGAAVGDQVRVTTPGDAIGRGASWLVVGRPVTGAADPAAAAAAIADEVAAATGRTTT
jgi:orotidine-5'-phosphate decarboxylase